MHVCRKSHLNPQVPTYMPAQISECQLSFVIFFLMNFYAHTCLRFASVARKQRQESSNSRGSSLGQMQNRNIVIQKVVLYPDWFVFDYYSIRSK